MSTLNLSDRVCMSEKRSAPAHRPGLWARTEVIAGYGRHKDNKGGTYLDREIFRKSNIVPIGGVQYVMEKLFNVAGQVNTGYITDPDADFSFGSTTNTALNTAAAIAPYSIQHHVCLFGVGTGGAPENSTTASDALYNERTLVQPIPFRVVVENDANFPNLTTTEDAMYWGKRTMDVLGDVAGPVVAYYLKKFDTDPEIIHLWRDNVDPDEDGTNVTDGGANSVFSSTRTESIESFTEINLTIGKKDLKQYFSAIGMPESARINELALYCAELDRSTGDYTNIKLFSKLNFQTEPLSTTKDMEIIYRVYGS